MYRLITLIIAVGYTNAQLTAQTSVAPDLRECYTDPFLMNRNNLPPSTMPVLIDIIRKIEDHPDVNMDLRQLSTLLLHTYRQDGMEFHQPESLAVDSSRVLPYSPTFHAFHRHRLLLTRLLSNNLQVLANNTLDSVSKCALHHMLSTTVDARVRGDESNCNQLSQYRALRAPRSIQEDVEMLDASKMKAHHKRGQMRYNPKDEVTINDGSMSAKSGKILGDSQCPLLTGVVQSRWGDVSGGNLIAGIAAGAQPQQVPVLTLAKGSVLNYNDVQQAVNNIYPATLSGDLAEAVLIQGIDRGSSSISIGTAGNWNSTQAPRHFMIRNRVNIEMTDPEIRGDIDGFMIGSTISSTLSVYSSLRLSQLLDMYYTARNGVFNPTLIACNRRQLGIENIQSSTLVSETYAFAAALDTNIPLQGTIIGGLQNLVSSAVTNFQAYSANNMNDLNCETTNASTNDFRLKTDLYVVLDLTWQYQTIYPAISHLVDAIDVEKFGSSITLLNAFDGSIVVNTTFSISEFHSNYTQTRHQAAQSGVNLATAYTNIRQNMQAIQNNEALRNYVGGNATVLLFLLNSGNVQSNNQIMEEARTINDTIPDLRVLYATSTLQFDNLRDLVRDQYADIFTVSLTQSSNFNTIMSPIVNRISEIGRRIVNPTCGSSFIGGLSGTRQFDDFVEPNYINFYALRANYFYESNENRRIRISRSGSGVGSLVVCHSRLNPQPRQTNGTVIVTNVNDVQDVICQTITSTGTVEISLQSACDNFGYIGQCPPFYVSVQSNTGGAASTSAACTDTSVCRFPTNIRYQVQIEELGCYSGAGSLTGSVAFMLGMLLMTIYRSM